MIFVLQEVLHPQPEIFQAELAEVFASDGKWIKIVLFEISPKLAPPLLVFAPQKTEAQKEQRYDDRPDDIDREFALQCVNHDCASTIHAPNIFQIGGRVGLLRKAARIHGCFSSHSFWKAGSVRNGSQIGSSFKSAGVIAGGP